jgi:hypothetical protein
VTACVYVSIVTRLEACLRSSRMTLMSALLARRRVEYVWRLLSEFGIGGAGYLNAYTTLIKERGYSPGSVQTQVQLITRFSEWLRRAHTEVHALDETIVERYLRRHHSARFARPGDAAGLYRFLVSAGTNS